MAGRIKTKHPEPTKQGVNIDREKYDSMREAIVSVLGERGDMTFVGLREAVENQLADGFDGSVGRYDTTVELELKARSDIARVAGRRPQVVQLKRKPRRSK